MKSENEEEFQQATEMEEKTSEVKHEESVSGSLRCMEEMGRFDESAEDLAGLNTSLNLGPKADEGPFQSAGDSKDNVPMAYRPRHRHSSRQSLPRLPPSAATPEAISDSRAARPSSDGKGKNQLLPRYWPRITDQEIQQITSGDSKSVLTPLFEKVLSASDAGRIGRLVLPKACAEAYFPTISHAEGLPLRISDINGREWQFQFRFWPNNNSRMYVLEGVTPCIQAMHLQAGDTVTFSRLEPDGKLVMGYRKLQMDSVDGDYAGHKFSSTDYKASKGRDTQPTLSAADKRRGRPLGAKSKRLRLDNEDSHDLKASWEEAQELLRPPPGVMPTSVTIDGHQFEEYEEPPVLTKKTLTRTKPSGHQDRWVQCDECSKFRNVPLDVLLHTRWTCVDNIWDPRRASCSAIEELNNAEMDQLLDSLAGKAKRNAADLENPSGLDALATAAAIGDDKPPSPPPPPAATTKHPRHRPGCTCIVCIQPPSGKGPKHKSTCVCNVCLTVKRRFKTLMMRRKKRQSEREAETARKKSEPKATKAAATRKENGRGQQRYNTREAAAPQAAQPSPSPPPPPPPPPPPQSVVKVSNTGNSKFMTERGKALPFSGILGAAFQQVVSSADNQSSSGGGKGQIDLNSQPDRDEVRMSMMRLLQDASLPLDMYLKQQGIASLVPGGAPTFAAAAALGGGGDDTSVDNQNQQQQQHEQQQQHQ